MGTQLRHLLRDTMIATAPPIRQDTGRQFPKRAAGKQREPMIGSTAPREAKRADPATYQVGQHTIALAGLQLLLGYEWLVSGLDKLLYASFPAAVGQLLTDTLQGGKIPAPFAAFLRLVVLPHSVMFGYLVEWGEILAGMGLLAGAIMTLLAPTAWRRLAPEAWHWLARGQRMSGWLAVGAALATGLMGLSFYLLDGAPSQWIMPSIAFGGALDTGLLLALGSAVLLADTAAGWLRRRDEAETTRRTVMGPNAE